MIGFVWWQATSCHFIPSLYKLFKIARQPSSRFSVMPCLLSSWRLPNAPVGPHSQCWQDCEKGFGIRFLVLAQNQPFAMTGFKDGLLQPAKLDLRPEVQVKVKFSLLKISTTVSHSSFVSRLTRSIHIFLQYFRPWLQVNTSSGWSRQQTLVKNWPISLIVKLKFELGFLHSSKY